MRLTPLWLFVDQLHDMSQSCVFAHLVEFLQIQTASFLSPEKIPVGDSSAPDIDLHNSVSRGTTQFSLVSNGAHQIVFLSLSLVQIEPCSEEVALQEADMAFTLGVKLFFTHGDIIKRIYVAEFFLGSQQEGHILEQDRVFWVVEVGAAQFLPREDAAGCFANGDTHLDPIQFGLLSLIQHLRIAVHIGEPILIVAFRVQHQHRTIRPYLRRRAVHDLDMALLIRQRRQYVLLYPRNFGLPNPLEFLVLIVGFSHVPLGLMTLLLDFLLFLLISTKQIWSEDFSFLEVLGFICKFVIGNRLLVGNVMKSGLTPILAEPAIIGPPFSTFPLSLFFSVFFSLRVQHTGDLDIALPV